jgi:hypothetical protein
VTFSGLVGTVVDVDVELHGVQHQRFDDLDVMLVGPGGQRALITPGRRPTLLGQLPAHQLRRR